jgi:hypothetical protein
MKRLPLVSLAFAVALTACTPVLVAQDFNFTATGIEGNGQSVSVTAVITLSSLGGGEYVATGATGTIVDPWGNTDTITGIVSAGSPGSVGYQNPFTFDNLVTIPAAFSGLSSGESYFDSYGILFSTSSPGYNVIIGPDEYYNDGNYQYSDNGLGGSVSYPLSPPNGPYDTTDVTIDITAVPESGAICMLFLCGVGLLAGFSCKAR